MSSKTCFQEALLVINDAFIATYEKVKGRWLRTLQELDRAANAGSAKQLVKADEDHDHDQVMGGSGEASRIGAGEESSFQLSSTVSLDQAFWPQKICHTLAEETASLPGVSPLVQRKNFILSDADNWLFSFSLLMKYY